jgi:hypothetical protein
MHYEIEQASPEVGTNAEPERWHVVAIIDTEVVPTPLTLDTIDRALAYVARTPGTLRVIEVTDEGERVLAEAGTSRDAAPGRPRITRSSCAKPTRTGGAAPAGGRSSACCPTRWWRRSSLAACRRRRRTPDA